jgi:hypothetical protein
VIFVILVATGVTTGLLVWWLSSGYAADNARQPADFTTRLFIVDDSWLVERDSDAGYRQPMIAVVRPRGADILLRVLYPTGDEATRINALTPGDRISVRFLTGEMAQAERQNLFERAIDAVTGDAMKMVTVYRLSHDGSEYFVRPDNQMNSGHRFAHVDLTWLLAAGGAIVIGIAAIIGAVRRRRAARLTPGERMMAAQRQSQGRRSS